MTKEKFVHSIGNFKVLSEEKVEAQTDGHVFREILKNSKMYEDSYLILHILYCASITKSVGSIVESWGSEIEQLASSKRPITEDRLHYEMMICLNGPGIAHSIKVVNNALSRLRSEYKRVNDRMGRHFRRRSDNIATYLVSKVVMG